MTAHGETRPPRDEGVTAPARTQLLGSEGAALAGTERDRAEQPGTQCGRPRAREDAGPEVSHQPLTKTPAVESPRSGFPVRSRSELTQYLKNNPIHLRAHRRGFGPRVSHPDFIGPREPEPRINPGRIAYDSRGRSYCVILKDAREQARCEAFERWEASP